ncbi:TetR/AcrR family transcriptional regulator [Actinomadura madurae]|uniref:TetR/AcrR family transcriptional regulator n=1 Tax=Actinomadura madurae TaxID=1993 RepID=UPI002025CD46|nr:TetR/AcrR family transcriptional regulator [Actinomadura madurae]MCP9948124.1 TetR/AcrR family transcriptional regulator [Actinomadura madurae]MCP9964897.1 TetR/AcrR family transcriptional regulator [Actinomadura madurae]MCP9977384.1 TetR/AcrR family transcriptional regulator [Actinomadura madurae]MCQ0011110.1 TetR/AcrR family transcriptional regulator [Actinomadura madurae]MCQ0013565.1 TetR/AcrR family transcriptional regulator [Actinomadura madurae]
MSGSVKGDGVRRADAQRNRERILRAARELVREPGELRLNAVARACGIGQGTLYRHFPTREDLLAEVYRREVDELVAAAPHLLATHQPVDALAAWFDRVAAYARVKRDVFAAVEAATGHDLAAHSLGPIGEAVELLLAAGRSAGSVRPDAEARDVIVLISWLSRLDDAELDARGPRLLSILVDGLRARRPPAAGDQAGSPEGR